MRKAILKYFNTKFHETIIDQENISIFEMFSNKHLIRSMMERMTHIHKHV